MAAKRLNLTFLQGETFQRVIRWETTPFIYKPITAISKAAPVQVTAVGHGLTSGWRVAVIDVLGMLEINAEHYPPYDSEFFPCTVVDTDNVTINRISSAGFTTYASGGYLMFYTPVDLVGYSARMKIKDRIGGTVITTFTSDAPDNTFVIDTAALTITMTVSAAATEALTFTKAVYDLEMVSPTGVVTRIFSGSLSLSREVTTP